MALVNHAKKEINAKIVYFGPSGSGKRAALEYIHARIKPSLRGELKNVPAGSDALFCFDFSPFDTPLADGYRVRLHVYTLSGTVSNPATWKMTLKGCDGVVILIDSAAERLAEAQASVAQVRDFLSAYGVGLHDIPAVLQLNSTDRQNAGQDDNNLAATLGLTALPVCRSRTASGEGVLEALSSLSRLVLGRIREQRTPGAGVDTLEVSSAEPAPTVVPSPDGYQNLQPAASSAARCDLPVQSAGQLHLSVAVPEYDEGGTSIRIPLNITCGTTCRRLIVTVAISPE